MRLVNISLILLGLSIDAPAHAIGKELVVGLQPTQPVRTLIARHETLAIHLRKELDRPVRLVSAKNSRIFGQRLLKGDYELALAPAHMTRLAQQERAGYPLVRYEQDVPVFLLTRQTEPHFTPMDLKNKVLAVPDAAMLATIAGEHWLAQQQQLVANRDYTVLVTGSYASAVHAVVNGQADMALGALGGIGQARPEDIQQLRIIKEVASIPQLIFVARHNTSTKNRADLQRALLTF